MALIKCHECGRNISDKAAYCPGCGTAVYAPGSVANKNNYSKQLIALVFVVLFISVIWANNNKDKSSKSDDTSAYVPQTGTAGALAKAESYLGSGAFSYTGLIEQLEFAGFSFDEAAYAADNCGADWKEQAVKKAKSYISSSAFSYTGLIDQLEYSGFTAEEAKYAADNCEADWKEQAVKKALSYMNTFPDWTKSRLIEQLEFNGFTSEEAAYGADNCGKSW